MNLSKTAKRLTAKYLPGGKYHCALCDRQVRRFLPYSQPRAPLMQALACVGSDVANFACPHCHAHDRERHLFLYARTMGLFADMRGKDILHFAPEHGLSRYIAKAGPRRYLRCDLEPRTSEVQRVDMLGMPFANGTFDVVVANHVLEHVTDDRRALAEIERILRPGGWAILQTPFSAKLVRTWEDSGIQDELARLHAFGQADHVRLYGRDIFSRIESSGLHADIRTHAQSLPHVDAVRAGVNAEEPLFLFRKPTSTQP